GIGHPSQPLIAHPSHPDAVFVLATDGALEVHAPGVAVGIEVDGAERNLDLDRPADLAAADASIPYAVPCAIVAVDAEQRVGHQARWVHLEEVTGTRVE